MKKILITAIITVFLISGVYALEASIQPSNPDDILLESPDYKKSVTFDATASSGSIKSYEWKVLETSQKDNGTEATFSFERVSPSQKTIQLIVTNSSGNTDIEEVTQTIHDRPNLTISASDTSVDLKDSGGSVTVDFSSSVTNKFDRISKSKKVNYEWTVDNNQESTSSSFSYDFSETGSYDVELTVTDNAGYSNSDTIDVDVENTSTATQQQQQQQNSKTNNTESFEESVFLGSFSSGDEKSVGFSNSPITGINITVSESVSSAELKSKSQTDLPGEADNAPSGQVYKYVELEKVNFSNDDISNVDFEFDVSKSWVTDKNINENSIKLQRWNGGSWDSLDTSKVSENDYNIFFSANSDKLSVFSITGEKKKAQIEITDLSISPKKLDPNQNATITVVVENKGDIAGNKTISLNLAGELFKEEVTGLSPGDTAQVKFTKNFTEEGNYKVEVDGKSASITVGDPVKALDTGNKTENATSTDVKDDLPVMLISFVIIVLGVVVALGAYFYTHEEEREELIEELKEVADEVREFLNSEEEKDEDFEWNGFDN